MSTAGAERRPLYATEGKAKLGPNAFRSTSTFPSNGPSATDGQRNDMAGHTRISQDFEFVCTQMCEASPEEGRSRSCGREPSQADSIRGTDVLGAAEPRGIHRDTARLLYLTSDLKPKCLHEGSPCAMGRCGAARGWVGIGPEGTSGDPHQATGRTLPYSQWVALGEALLSDMLRGVPGRTIVPNDCGGGQSHLLLLRRPPPSLRLAARSVQPVRGACRRQSGPAPDAPTVRL